MPLPRTPDFQRHRYNTRRAFASSSRQAQTEPPSSPEAYQDIAGFVPTSANTVGQNYSTFSTSPLNQFATTFDSQPQNFNQQRPRTANDNQTVIENVNFRNNIAPNQNSLRNFRHSLPANLSSNVLPPNTCFQNIPIANNTLQTSNNITVSSINHPIVTAMPILNTTAPNFTALPNIEQSNVLPSINQALPNFATNNVNLIPNSNVRPNLNVNMQNWQEQNVLNSNFVPNLNSARPNAQLNAPYSNAYCNYAPLLNANSSNVASQIKLPEFDGKNIHPIVFINMLEQLILSGQVQFSQMSTWVINYFKDEAKPWAEAMIYSFNDFSSFKQNFLQHFWSDIKQAQVRNRIEAGKYKSNDGDYVAYFLKLVADARFLQPPYPEILLVSAIARHFVPNVRSCLIGTKTIAEALERLRQADYIMQADVHFSKPALDKTVSPQLNATSNHKNFPTNKPFFNRPARYNNAVAAIEFSENENQYGLNTLNKSIQEEQSCYHPNSCRTNCSIIPRSQNRPVLEFTQDYSNNDSHLCVDQSNERCKCPNYTRYSRNDSETRRNLPNSSSFSNQAISVENSSDSQDTKAEN